MKVFISWSGTKSRAVASKLRDWLPSVIQGITPWMSKHDISAGKRWSKELADGLNGAKYGIICLTSDNYEAPWVLFETGALSNSLNDTLVCPYLIDFESINIQSSPLSQFQSKRANKEETFDLLKALNANYAGNVLSNNDLLDLFENNWKALEKTIKKACSKEGESFNSSNNIHIGDPNIRILGSQEEYDKSFLTALSNTNLWWFKGGTGSYTRKVTIPAIINNHQEKSTVLQKEIQLELLDPMDDNLCSDYSKYKQELRVEKNLIDPNQNKLSPQQIKLSVLATLLIAYICCQICPIIRITIGFHKVMTTLRFELSAEYVFITSANIKTPPLRINKENQMYDSFKHELEWSWKALEQNDLANNVRNRKGQSKKGRGKKTLNRKALRIVIVNNLEPVLGEKKDGWNKINNDVINEITNKEMKKVFNLFFKGLDLSDEDYKEIRKKCLGIKELGSTKTSEKS